VGTKWVSSEVLSIETAQKSCIDNNF